MGDVVAGVVKTVERIDRYEINYIGGSGTTSLSTLIALLEELMGEEASIVEKAIPRGDVVRTFADTSKAERLLGFEAKVSIKEGLRAFIQWYRKERRP